MSLGDLDDRKEAAPRGITAPSSGERHSPPIELAVEEGLVQAAAGRQDKPPRGSRQPLRTREEIKEHLKQVRRVS